MFGELVARYDLAGGRYVVLAAGLPTASRPEYARLLRERYGVEMRVVAGCIAGQPLLDYINGYNAMSMAAVDRRFRRDIFTEADAEAAKNWRRAHPAPSSR